MLILLSPSKNMNFDTPPAPRRTTPALAARTADLAGVTRKLSKAKIKALMELSDDLAQLNYDRFQAFDAVADPDATGAPAAFAFTGDVHLGLDARSLPAADLDWAQDHLRILSGLYGVLRPLDAIQPYRLEMGRKLKTKKGEDLYDFWGGDIAAELNASLDQAQERTVVNLASAEYFKAVDKATLDARVIDVSFKEEKDGKARALFMFLKRARGRMARWMIEERVTRADQLTGFSWDGYAFREDLSKPDSLVFTRPQPAKKAA